MGHSLVGGRPFDVYGDLDKTYFGCFFFLVLKGAENRHVFLGCSVNCGLIGVYMQYAILLINDHNIKKVCHTRRLHALVRTFSLSLFISNPLEVAALSVVFVLLYFERFAI